MRLRGRSTRVSAVWFTAALLVTPLRLALLLRERQAQCEYYAETNGYRVLELRN